jgi:serine protease Do
LQDVMKRLGGSGAMMLALGWGVVCFAAPWSGLAAQSARMARSAPGYLGIDCRDVNDDEISSLKLKDARGAEIIRVDHDGPAGKMGLREHDVVVQMNGAPITGREQISRLLRETAPGRTIALVISRDGQQMTLTALMGDKSEVERQAWEQHLSVPPAPGPQAPATGLPGDDPLSQTQTVAAAPAPAKYSKGFLGTILLSPAYTGAVLERISPQLGQFFGVPRGTGLLVTSVENNSPAAAAGVRAGDVVVRANARLVTSMTNWTKIVREAKGKAVEVVVLRDKQEKTLMLTPDARKHS